MLHNYIFSFLVFLGASFNLYGEARIKLGVDRFFEEGYVATLKGKSVGLITNQTGMDSHLRSTLDLFKERAVDYKLVALFAPEHGINGTFYAADKVEDAILDKKIPIYSLHGVTRRPTEAMLKGIDVLIYDIQDIGSRSYTYATTLFYLMEAAAKKGIELIVLDRPNPINGVVVDGPMLDKKWRSFLGYINVPYCHGMTIGELASFFNEEYEIDCSLKVVPMEGWKRSMTFEDTGLYWVPTSPYIPEQDTPFFYASTGILGALSWVNIGIGYTQPFKIVGAPWIDAESFAHKLNAQKLPGVFFLPYHFRPFYGLYSKEECHGVKLIITNHLCYRPLAVQYLLIGMLKSLYPKQIEAKLKEFDQTRKQSFCKVNGNEQLLTYLQTEKYAAWKMIRFEEKEREIFLEKRKRYLLYR